LSAITLTVSVLRSTKVFTRLKPDRVEYGTGHAVSDDEGRVIQLDFGDIRVINAYFPSGTSGEERQGYKYQWLDEFFEYLEGLKKKIPRLIVWRIDYISVTDPLKGSLVKAQIYPDIKQSDHCPVHLELAVGG
jgi:exonuclease III